MQSPALIVCGLFDDGHSDSCEIIPHCSFDLYFSNNEQCWASFCAYWPSVCLWRNVCLGLLPTFWLDCSFFWYWAAWAAFIFWGLILCQSFHLLLFFFYFILFFKLYIIVLVLPNIKMNPPQVYMCSPSWTHLPPPSPFHPSGSSQCTSPKHPVSCMLLFFPVLRVVFLPHL